LAYLHQLAHPSTTATVKGRRGASARG
jgi:hypothetical protein